MNYNFEREKLEKSEEWPGVQLNKVSISIDLWFLPAKVLALLNVQRGNWIGIETFRNNVYIFGTEDV